MHKELIDTLRETEQERLAEILATDDTSEQTRIRDLED